MTSKAITILNCAIGGTAALGVAGTITFGVLWGESRHQGDTPEPIGTTLEITEGHWLKGFKYGVTKEQIEEEFGDTLVIPKDVTMVLPYAFYDGENSTIPSSITHLKFENDDPTGTGYACQQICDYAFAEANFEDVVFTCQRAQPDGTPHPNLAYWELKEGYWGLQHIGNSAFIDCTNLKKG